MKTEQAFLNENVAGNNNAENHHRIGDLEFEGFAENLNLEKKAKSELSGLKTWLEISEPYQNYLKQDLTFDRLDDISAQYYDLTKNKTGKDVSNLGELLAEEASAIKSKADSYYESILRMERHNQPLVQMHLADRDWAEKRSEMDQSRQLKHNALLSSLRSINRLCLDIIPKKVGVKLDSRGLFSLAQLTDENRSIAGQWAYDSAFAERIRLQIDKINKKIREIDK